MRLTVDGKALAGALKWSGRFVARRAMRPALNAVAAEVRDARLTLRTCNGEDFGVRRVQCSVEDPGEAAVHFGTLASAVVGSGPVTITLDGARLLVSEGPRKTRIATLPYDEIPAHPCPPEGGKPTDDAFWGLFRAVAAAALGDDSTGRDYLRSVVSTGGLMCATDTHRLHAAKCADEDGRFPARIAAAVEGRPSLSAHDSRAFLYSEEYDAAFSGHPGTYPDVHRVIPKEFSRTWTMDKSELSDALRFLAGKAIEVKPRTGNQVTERVVLRHEDGRVALRAINESLSETEIDVPCTGKNADITIAVNRSYLLDALVMCDGDACCLQMTENTRPIVLSAAPDERDRFAVVMPMAL